MTTHPSPFHRQRQSNKTLDPNSDTARFLYTILDQLELKNINWNKVAYNLNITNGHAARMRWSRFKAQLEGVDNSYARRNNKKSMTPRKRKASRVERQSSYSQAHIYDEIAAKRVKTRTNEDMKMENMRGDDLGCSGEANYDTTGAEDTRRMSTINGVNVHHPTVTLINATTAKPPFFPIRPDAASNISGNNQYQASNYIPHQPNNRVYRTPDSQATHHWQQRFPSSAYTYNPQRPSMASPVYSATPNVYHNPYGNHYPQMYSYNQQVTSNRFYPQQRFTPHPYYRRPEGTTSLVSTMPSAQRRPSLADQALKLNQSNPTNTKPPSSIGSQAPIQGCNLTFPTTTVSSQPSAQVQAVELASQASYPWPHSEASLPQFMQSALGPGTDSPTLRRPVDTTNSVVNNGRQGDGAINTSPTNSSFRQAEHTQDTNIKELTGHSTVTRTSTGMIDGARNGVEAAANTVVIKPQPAEEEGAIPHIKIEADADGNGAMVV